MESNEGESIKADPGVELQAVSTPSDMDVDTPPPPTKRIKSMTSREPSPLGMGPNSPSSAHHEDTLTSAKQEASPLREASENAYDRIKIEPDLAPDITVSTVKIETTDATATLKTESATVASLSQPEEEILQVQATKKKKPSSSSTASKKEASASSASSKTKKAANSSKKASSSMSSSTQQDPSPTTSSSRGKPKSEETYSPLPDKADVEEDEEDNTLYCICQRRQDDVEGGMIMCDRCEQWYHYRCMAITEDDVELVDQFICPPCHQVTGEQTTYKAACARVACRRAAMMPFSKYCSDRCGELAVMGKLAALKVGAGKNGKAAKEGWEADGRVKMARKTEGFTQPSTRWGEENREWKMVVQGLERSRVGARLDLAGTFAMMVKRDEQNSVQGNGVPNGVATGTINGAATQPSTSPLPLIRDVAAAPSASLPCASVSSATSLIALDEQLHLVDTQIHAVDYQKARLNARLDRLDLRSTLLHLVSDRVPTLPPIGSSSTTATTELNSSEAPDHLGGADHDGDEDMADADMPKKTKKKKGGSKSKSKSASSTDATSGGPRCGYDQRLHWDDAEFDAWSQSPLGRCILSHDAPLDGTLDDSPDTENEQAGPGPKVVCGVAKRRCRRHLDWSNLCELVLDAEKATLNADSSVLTRRKLALVQTKDRLTDEVKAVQRIREVQEMRERRMAEERDRDLARAVASQGTRRETVH